MNITYLYMNNDNFYWTEETDEYIIKYMNSDDINEREAIFTDHLYKPFYKLCENICRRYSFPHIKEYYNLRQYDEDMINMALSYIVMKIQAKTFSGTQGFSYFSIVCKNYLIQTNNKLYRESLKFISIDDDNENSSEEEYKKEIFELTTPSKEINNNINYKDFYIKFLQYLKELRKIHLDKQ